MARTRTQRIWDRGHGLSLEPATAYGVWLGSARFIVSHRPLSAAILGLIVHIPFVVRYDLHFQPESALSMMMSRSIVEGEWPVFFWGQAYSGTYGNYLTAVAFRVFGKSVPLAGLVSLGIWALGVGLTTALAERLLGGRAASWVGLAAAVASPYANHYITQPYLSYETAPVLSIGVLAGLLWSQKLLNLPLGIRTAACWMLLGFLLGFGWWTTRLFLPGAAAAALAVVLRGRRRAQAVRRALAGIALLLPGFLVGASPDILCRLGYLVHYTMYPQTASRFEFEVAPLSQIPMSLLQAFAALSAYFDADPYARFPEGLTFARALESGLEPYADPEFASGLVASLHDRALLVVVIAIFLVTVRTAARAWQQRDLPLLSLCIVPFIHLAVIGLSGRTGGGYFEARRYWYGSLLIWPLLIGNAIALGEASRVAAVRVGVRVLAGLFLLSSLVNQARMLTLPDELAELRVLVRALEASGERAVLMPHDAWFVASLSGGRIEAMSKDSIRRRPEIAERVAAGDRVAVAFSGPGSLTLESFELLNTRFVKDGAARRAGVWQWVPFRAVPGDGVAEQSTADESGMAPTAPHAPE